MKLKSKHDDVPETRLQNRALIQAYLSAIAMIEGPQEVRDFIVKHLRGTGDAVSQVVADMFDPETEIDISATLTVENGNELSASKLREARDVEITHAVNAHLSEGQNQKRAFHEVHKTLVLPATKNKRERSLSLKQIGKIWRAKRDRVEADARAKRDGVEADAKWFETWENTIASEVEAKVRNGIRPKRAIEITAQGHDLSKRKVQKLHRKYRRTKRLDLSQE